MRPAACARGLLLACAASACGGCVAPRPGEPLVRRGDEIAICGQLFHTGAPVVLWTDAGGYDAYRVEPRFAATTASAPATQAARYGPVRGGLAEPLAERVRRGGWRCEDLRECVDLLVLHYDACGVSRRCFEILHDVRGLSVHFMIDLDGTIYQTLDVKERAWHAGPANDRSVGVEIANIGAYESAEPLRAWYAADRHGRTRITVPPALGETFRSTLRPARPAPILGEIHGHPLVQYDFTPQQYDSLARLTAALCRVLPRIRPVMPRGPGGAVLTRALTAAELAGFHGIVGHYHVTTQKVDPGPGFDWERLARDLRAWVSE